jgi:hypothetical protein
MVKYTLERPAKQDKPHGNGHFMRKNNSWQEKCNLPFEEKEHLD